MGREATAEVCCKPDTKELITEVKPDGVTFDHWLRGDPRLPDGGEQ